MNKHSMAISCALVGLGIAGFATEFSKVGVMCGLGFGLFIGYFIAGLLTAKGNILHEDFIAMGTLTGKTLDEITAKVGAPNAITSCTVAETGKPGSLCTWTKNPYSITLLFDENNVCLGVNNEIKA